MTYDPVNGHMVFSSNSSQSLVLFCTEADTESHGRLALLSGRTLGASGHVTPAFNAPSCTTLHQISRMSIPFWANSVRTFESPLLENGVNEKTFQDVEGHEPSSRIESNPLAPCVGLH